MSLDCALFLDRALELSHFIAPMHLSQSASVLQHSLSPLRGIGQLQDIVSDDGGALAPQLMQDMELISGIGDFCQVYVTYKT